MITIIIGACAVAVALLRRPINIDDNNNSNDNSCKTIDNTIAGKTTHIYIHTYIYTYIHIHIHVTYVYVTRKTIGTTVTIP